LFALVQEEEAKGDALNCRNGRVNYENKDVHNYFKVGDCINVRKSQLYG